MSGLLEKKHGKSNKSQICFVMNLLGSFGKFKPQDAHGPKGLLQM
jgi:hypothetical protein